MSGPWEQYQGNGPWSQYQQNADVEQTGANQGTPIYGDLPTAIGGKPNIVRYEQQPEQAPRTVADYAKAFLEVPATIGSAAVAPFIGVGAGMIENARKGTNQRVDRPELAQRFTYEPTSPVSQDVISSLGGALDSAKIPAYVPSAGNVARATQGAAQTIPSYAKAMGQELKTTVMQDPKVQRGVESLQNVGETLKQKITPAPKPYSPSEKALSNIADSAFQRAKKEGVEIDTQKFVDDAKNIVIDLRQLGFDERLHPNVTVAVETLLNPKYTKDLAELKTIREFIKQAQGSTVPKERELGTVLKQRFDEYLATLPKESLTGGSKEGLRAWKEGQMAYTRLGKSQVFTDMLERAEFDAQTIGVEKSLTNQIISLAKNEKRKRLFTKSEQEMIEDVAKGGNVQNFLRAMAKYSPSNPITSAMSGAVGAGGGALLSSSPEAAMIGAVVIPAIGGSAKLGATKMRKTQIEKLADAMRANPNAGQQVDFSKPAANPITNNDRIAEILRRFNQGDQ